MDKRKQSGVVTSDCGIIILDLFGQMQLCNMDLEHKLKYNTNANDVGYKRCQDDMDKKMKDLRSCLLSD